MSAEPSRMIVVEPTHADVVHAILNSTPPLRPIENGVPNTYVISEACEIEATLTGYTWTVQSVTCR